MDRNPYEVNSIADSMTNIPNAVTEGKHMGNDSEMNASGQEPAENNAARNPSVPDLAGTSGIINYSVQEPQSNRVASESLPGEHIPENNNTENHSWQGQPSGYNTTGTNAGQGQPSGYNTTGTNAGQGQPSGYNPAGTNAGQGQPSGYNPAGTNAGQGQPSGYNPAGNNPGQVNAGNNNSYNNQGQGTGFAQNPYVQNSYIQNSNFQNRNLNNRNQTQNSWNGYGQNYTPYQPSYQSEKEEPVSVLDWVGTILIAVVPCVGLIMYIVWAFSADTKKSKANYCKATLIIMLAVLAFYVLLIVLMVAFSISSFYY